MKCKVLSKYFQTIKVQKRENGTEQYKSNSSEWNHHEKNASPDTSVHTNTNENN